jgi:type IV fimbrial biogenesis protein FimT
MTTRLFQRTRRGFTLIELLVVVAVVAVILMLAAPSFRDMIEMQRLRGTSAQVGTDVQFARTEAVSRQQPVVMRIGSRSTAPAGTCYVIYTCNEAAFACDCQCGRGAGSACTVDPRWTEVRTVEVASSSGVALTPYMDLFPPAVLTDLQIRFDPLTGAAMRFVADPGSASIDSNAAGNVEASLTRDGRTLRTMVNVAGRPSVCSPAARRVADTAVCP